jgi:hypothetical protein
MMPLAATTTELYVPYLVSFMILFVVLTFYVANLCADPLGPCTLGSKAITISGQTFCSTCTPGKYSAVQSSVRTCLQCPKGSYSSNYGSSSCSLCPKNFYSNTPGLSACLECPKPTFTATTGSTSLLDCKVQTCSDWQNVTDANGNHYFADSGASLRFWLAQDYCQSLKHGARLPAPKTSNITSFLLSTSTLWMGMYMLMGSGASFASTSFYWADQTVASTSDNLTTLLSSCSFSAMTASCARKSSGSSVTCGPCSENQPFWCQVDQEYCGQSCSLGQVLNYATVPYACTSCPMGRFQNQTNVVDCIDCISGTFTNSTGQSSCLPCAPGFFSTSAASQSCSSCGAGFFSNVSGFASNCTSNACPLGTFSVSGQSYCTNCSSGTFAATTGRSSCAICPSGTFATSSGQSFCGTCPYGTYAIDGSSTCLSCPAGTYTTGPSSFCSSCQTGRYQSLTGQTLCNLCPSGTFANTTGSSACIACEVGKFSTGNSPGSSICIDCAVGLYTNITSQSTCISCSSGYYSAVSGASFCEVCRAGNFSTGGALCTPCVPGTYSNVNGLSACFLCFPGMYATLHGSSSCTLCGSGNFSDSVTQCRPCQPGKYTSINGESTCSNCTAGKTSTIGLTFCSSCAAGTFSSVTGSPECLPCPSGKYTMIAEQTACTECPNGTSAAATGASVCSPCQLGRFSDRSEAKVIPCGLCPVTSYANQTGSTSCFRCNALTDTKSEGSTSILQCLCQSGYYGNVQVEECRPCSQSEAFSCPTGSVIPWIAPGYFRSGPSGEASNIAYICSPTVACSKTEFDAFTTCGTGYTGFICGECDNGFYKYSGACKHCPTDLAKWLTIIGAVIFLLLLVWRVTDQRSQIPTDVRVTVQALQLIALFPNISVKWPKFLITIFQFYSIFVRSFFLESFSLPKTLRMSTLNCFLQNVQSRFHSGISTTSNF